MRRASVSVVANIAEGFERSGNAEFIQFLSIAKGSAGEVRALICAAFDSGYVDETTFNAMRSDALEVSRVLNGLVEYLRKSELKGPKYRDQIRDGANEFEV
ncbi:MAG: four helix bundle protein [Thermoanaerobaculia bacterium]